MENMERMKARMVHRGPDADGTWISEDGEVCLGHQRLSIMDLSVNGAQPMASHSGRYVISYNGEIYNAPFLRDKLISEGKVSSFRGTCDTEVLLEAIEAYGLEETLTMCKGMFAIAVYDTREKVLQLARDRVGEKPLYFGFLTESEAEGADPAFVFASDVGCIAELEGFRQKVDRGVLDMYFIHGYIPAPFSVYEGISKLIPGMILTIRAPFTKENIRVGAYWSMEEAALRGRSQPFTGTRQEASEELERLLREAIRGQMEADVPLGAFLSAGIDSSTIVALMQSVSPGKVKTFTIGMREQKYNEAEYAAQIAQHLGTEHTEMYISEEDARRVVPLLPRMFSEPFADSSQIPTYLVSRMTRDHVTVSLSGDAGDELFCGYTSYASVERIWNKIRKVPLWLRKPASSIVLASPLAKKDIYRIKGKLLAAKDPEEVHLLELETDPLTTQISLDEGYGYTHLHHYGDKLGEVNRDCMLMDMKLYHPDDILVKVDRTAMAVSLETRVPFLDKDVVEFAWTLPIDYLRMKPGQGSPEGQSHAGDNAGGTIGKLVLRDVLYRYVPREMMDRPKKGFSIPVRKWLKSGELRDWAESLLNRNKLEAQGYLNPDVVLKIWSDFTERGIWREQIWYILMFQAWLEEQPALN